MTQKPELLKWCLIISYFNEIEGPKIFYCNSLLNSIKHTDLEKILDVLDYNIGEETYIFAFRKHQIINYLFYINSKFARGGQDLIMISYVIEPEYFRMKNVDEFKYLESKKPILEKYAKELKALSDFPNILRNKNITSFNKSLHSKEFWIQFRELYNKYLKLLSPIFMDEFEKWIPILPQCPICYEKKRIEIPERIINSENRSLTNIKIPKYKICQHAFVVSVDKNFKVHESENIDFDLTSFEKQNKLKPFNINVFKIKSNIKPQLLVNILYVLLHGKKVLLILRKSNEFNKELINFFQYIFQDSFKIDISIKNKREFKKEKTYYKNHIVLMRYHPKYINKPKIDNFEFEKEIIDYFYKKNDPIACIISLKNKIQEIYGLSQKLSEMNTKTGYIQRKEAIRYLEDTFFLRIKKDFFYFLLGVVKNYFAINIKLSYEVLAKRIDEMWGIRQ